MKGQSSSDAVAWPPPYTVRVSARAKYCRLRVLPAKGLEVVVPRGFDPGRAGDIVERHKDWVCRTLKRYTQEKPVEGMPDTVVLHGGRMALTVLYNARAGEEPLSAIPVRSDKDSPRAADELQEWVRGYAYRVLGSDVAQLADRHGMTYSALRFRRQRSRWGSCTSRGSLSLNTCLVFLPPELSRLVILHELAHTRHMDHGQGFWRELFRMEPKALELDRRLRKAWRHVPDWIWL